jgi:hypothetical protein
LSEIALICEGAKLLPHYKIIRIPNRRGKYARCLKPRLASEG